MKPTRLFVAATLSFFLLPTGALAAPPIAPPEESAAMQKPAPTAPAPEKKFVFGNESEAGLVISTGNARAQTYSLKQLNSFEFKKNLFKLSGRFLKTDAEGIEKARTWGIAARYEREFHPRLSAYVGQGIESDIFAGYLQRYHTDIGPKVPLFSKEKIKWWVEGGYRFTRENRRDPKTSLNMHYLRLYSEMQNQWTESVSTKLWLEYLPNLSTTTDWQFNAELSMNMALTRIFSVKLGYLVKYDHLPAPGARTTTDGQITTALVAKL